MLKLNKSIITYRNWSNKEGKVPWDWNSFYADEDCSQ